MIFAQCSIKAATVALPMPALAPVTSAVFPERSLLMTNKDFIAPDDQIAVSANSAKVTETGQPNRVETAR